MADQQERDYRQLVFRGVFFLFLASIPFLLHQLYLNWTAHPDVVRFATGTEGGRHREVAEAVGNALQKSIDVKVEFVETRGSLRNIELLQSGKVDFAMFQPESVASENLEDDRFRSVANVYSEVVQIIVRRGSGIESAADFVRGPLTKETKWRVSIGPQESGDHVTALMLLEHLGIGTAEIEVAEFSYAEAAERFRSGELDAAIVTLGLDAIVLSQLAAETAVGGDPLIDVIDVQFPDALVTRRLSLHPFVLPQGVYAARPVPTPSRDVRTVALRAQLITRQDVSTTVVAAVAKILLDQRFQQRIRLRELFESGKTFAGEKTLFPIHDGTAHEFDPELKPLLPPDFVEATEGLRSFVVSLLVAAWLAVRWWQTARDRQQEHRLDSYIRDVLEIEKAQMDLDQVEGRDESESLQLLLDDVTRLRQEALAELTARELHDDSAAAVFIQMCHALSDKINAKLSRQRIDVRLHELAVRLGPRADDSQSAANVTGKTAGNDADQDSSRP